MCDYCDAADRMGISIEAAIPVFEGMLEFMELAKDNDGWDEIRVHMDTIEMGPHGPQALFSVSKGDTQDEQTCIWWTAHDPDLITQLPS